MNSVVIHKIAGIQMLPRFAENEFNLDQILSYLEIVATQGAQLAIFPECALCGYCFESLQEAFPYASPFRGHQRSRLLQFATGSTRTPFLVC